RSLRTRLRRRRLRKGHKGLRASPLGRVSLRLRQRRQALPGRWAGRRTAFEPGLARGPGRGLAPATGGSCYCSCHVMEMARTPEETEAPLRLTQSCWVVFFWRSRPLLKKSTPVPKVRVTSVLPPAAVVTGRSTRRAPRAVGEESTMVGFAV